MNHSGYEAIGCLNASDAYDELTENIIDLIISDVMMPGIDGFEFASRVIDILQGEISVESAPGKGSTFVVKFKRMKE